MALDEIRQFFTENTGNLTYLYYCLLLIAGSLGMPVNADLVMLTAGALASIHVLKLPLVIGLAWISILTGDFLMFSIGRRHGERLLASRMIRRIFSETKQLRFRTFLLGNAKKSIFLIRFTPGVRSVSFLISGSMQVDTKTFLKMNLLSVTLYVPTLITVAYFTATQLQTWVTGYQTFSKLVLSLIGLFILLNAGKRVFRYYRRQNENSAI